MRASIENFRKIKSANFDLEENKINLLAGHGHQGKTSILKAITAAATMNALPFYGINGKQIVGKKNAIALVNESAREGSIEFDNVEILYPDCEVKTHGERKIKSSFYSAGLLSYTESDEKTRAQLLSTILGTTPTPEQSKEALQEIEGLPNQAIEKIMLSIESIGWDETFESTKKKATMMKGQWREVTGETWGKAKGKVWAPSDYSPDMDGLSLETLSEELQQQREGLEAAISKQGATEVEINILENLARNLDKLSLGREECEKLLNESTAELFNSEKELKKFKAKAQVHTCPKCSASLLIEGDKLVLNKENVEGDYKEYLSEKIKQLTSLYNANKEKNSTLTKRLEEYKTNLSKAEEAAEKLHKMDKDAGGNNQQEIIAEIDKYRKSVYESEARLKAMDIKNRADNHNKNVLMNLEIQSVLKPEGLRKTILENGLKKFNQVINQGCLGQYDIRVKNDLEVYMDGRNFALLSGSEQFICRGVLQMALSVLSGDNMIIFDGSDILDRVDRQKFFGALLKLGKTVIISMTILKKEETPNFKNLKAGKSFWIENGEIEEL